MKNKQLYLILSILSILTVLILWELSVRIFNVPDYILPTPSGIAIYIFFNSNLLLGHVFVTLYELVLGLFVSIILTLFLVITMVYSRALKHIFLPILIVSQSFPAVALAPLLVVWFGFGYTPKIILIFIISFFPLFITTLKGVTLIEKSLLYLMSSLGATKTQVLMKIRLPKSLPYFFSGLKASVFLGIIATIIGEFMSSEHGLGYLVLIGKSQLDSEMIFAALSILAVVGGLLYFFINYLEDFLLRRLRMTPIDD